VGQAFSHFLHSMQASVLRIFHLAGVATIWKIAPRGQMSLQNGLYMKIEMIMTARKTRKPSEKISLKNSWIPKNERIEIEIRDRR